MPKPARGEVAFEHVTFAYPGRPDLAALDDFTLRVRPGETGGAGRALGRGQDARCCRLLLRFYDPRPGACASTA